MQQIKKHVTATARKALQYILKGNRNLCFWESLKLPPRGVIQTACAGSLNAPTHNALASRTSGTRSTRSSALPLTRTHCPFNTGPERSGVQYGCCCCPQKKKRKGTRTKGDSKSGVGGEEEEQDKEEKEREELPREVSGFRGGPADSSPRTAWPPGRMCSGCVQECRPVEKTLALIIPEMRANVSELHPERLELSQAMEPAAERLLFTAPKRVAPVEVQVQILDVLKLRDPIQNCIASCGRDRATTEIQMQHL